MVFNLKLVQHAVKFSSNGVSKRRITAPMTIYRPVLITQRAGCGSIQGLRARMYTYEQTRNGFSYFYCKSRVLDDGLPTIPLDLELCPVPKETKPRIQKIHRKISVVFITQNFLPKGTKFRTIDLNTTYLILMKN